MRSHESGDLVLRRYLKTIYDLKLGQAIFILIILATLFYSLNFIGGLPNVPLFLAFFKLSPFLALADACLTSAVVGFAFERLVRRESRAELSGLLKDQLREQRETYLALLPNALLLDRDVQRQLVKEVKLDEFILTTLQSKFGDQMGEAVYHGVLCKATAFAELRRNYRHEISVSNISDSSVPLGVQQEFFNVVTEIQYDTILKKDQFLFAYVDSQDQFNQLLQSAVYEDIRVSPSNEVLQASSQPVFELLAIYVDDIPLNKVSQQEDGRCEVICEHPSLATKMHRNVTVRYRFKTKAEKIGHVIHTTVDYLTYDVTVDFNFG